MKKNILYSLIVFSIFFPLSVNGATINTEVGKNLDLNQCTSEPYQDKIISTNTGAYFSSCMVATCSSNKIKLNKYSDNKVNCLNGNSDPYIKITKSGCLDYLNSSCSGNEIKYCSQVSYYDCSKKSDGTAFTTTTKSTTKTTQTKTTSSTTTTQIIRDSRLQSLSLSNGSISFNPDVYEYNIMVESAINEIQVNAIAIDSTSQVSVSGNNNLVDGSVITITVKTTDEKVSTYKINVAKMNEVILSSNTNLKSLFVTGYSLPFSSNINNYNLIIDSGINMLEIIYEVEDKKSSVSISGNEDLEDGSTIIVTVVAEDGSEKDYIIDITVKKKSNVLSIIFIIIVILALGAVGFYVYKKFVQGKHGEKYEYE